MLQDELVYRPIFFSLSAQHLRTVGELRTEPLTGAATTNKDATHAKR